MAMTDLMPSSKNVENDDATDNADINDTVNDTTPSTIVKIDKSSLATSKHPLMHDWTLWYFKMDRTGDRNRNWEDNQKEVITFSYVEDFWSIYHHLLTASMLVQGCDYSLFKAGIKPMWEDPANSKGGRWLINLDRKQRVAVLDNVWLEIMMCLIGEAFGDDGDLVNGAVVNIRNKGDKISMWLGSATQSERVKSVGRKLKERLGIEHNIVLGFEVHEDTKIKMGSVVKNTFTI